VVWAEFRGWVHGVSFGVVPIVEGRSAIGADFCKRELPSNPVRLLAYWPFIHVSARLISSSLLSRHKVDFFRGLVRLKSSKTVNGNGSRERLNYEGCEFNSQTMPSCRLAVGCRRPLGLEEGLVWFICCLAFFVRCYWGGG